ncbi:S9 family peptidase [Bauldia sp.]|uniref:S9 family peptidase n=1 Tax=Bauldia sp. TaxID=2575872 RepID=UPI003BAA235C
MEVNRLSDLSYSPDGSEIVFGINSIDLDADQYLTAFVISDPNSDTVRTLLDPSPHISSIQWSPDGGTLAYLSSESGNTNLWLIDADGSNSRQVTELSEDISSFQWAPDGRSIAFVMPNPAYGHPPVDDSDSFDKVHLWLLALNDGLSGGTVTNLTENQPFSVSDWSGTWAYDWSPDSSTIVFAHQERPGLDPWTKAQLAVVDVETRNVTAVNAGNDRWKYFPKYSPDGKWLTFINAPGEFKWSFLWDIKLYSTETGETVALPPTERQLPFPWQWASDSQSLYYIENDRVTYSFYRMPIDGGEPEKVFGAPRDLSIPGLNTYLVSSFVDVAPDNATLAFIGQTYNTPPAVYVTDVSTFSPRKISDVNDRFLDIPIGRTELVRWRSLDNTEVEGLLTYPVDYQAGERYPLVVQIHGGPNGVDFNEYLPLMKFFATAAYPEQGYFVLRVNYRGTLGYGKKFREDLIGNFGILDYQDIMSGVNHVVDKSLADPDRLFVIGQSNGGTMTSWIVTQTDRFRSACPIAGETDYISLEGTNAYFQTSWYLGGSFIDHLQVFLNRSPIFHVRNVRTPTLIQGGLLDTNVPHGQLQEFYRALKRAGVDVHLVGYPGADHDFYPPKLYLRLLRSCLDWTVKHTPAGG